VRKSDILATFVWQLCRNPICLSLLKALRHLQASVGIVLPGIMPWKYDFHSFSVVHSNAHKVIAGFFLSPDPEVT
jgi:hypothetical protein